MRDSLKILEDEGQNFDNYLSFANIRITPKKLSFEGAFLGRRFKTSITIQNCGRESAFIRIMKPSLCAVDMRCLVDGTFLAPGMKITRSVKYQSQHVDKIITGIIPVIINGQKVHYPIEVTPAEEHVIVEPLEIDMGDININSLSHPREFKLSNIGAKISAFIIDTVQTENLIIIASPTRGRLESKESISCSITLVCSKDGEFQKQIWIRSSTPVRIVLSFRIVEPKWTVPEVLSSPVAALVEFPPTYIGAWSEKRLVVKNSSAAKLMFCIVGEYDFVDYSIEEADKLYNSYETFKVTPVEGLYLPTENKLLTFRFEPKNPSIPQGRNFCVLRIIGLDFQPVAEGMIMRTDKSSDQRGSIISDNADRNRDESEAIAQDTIDWSKVPPNTNCLKFYLFGLSESAQVKIVPDVLNVGPVKLKEQESRTLLITNLSDRLPIIVRYEKTANVSVKPGERSLKPLECFEFQILLAASRLGVQNKKIAFKLMYRDHRTDNDFHVGWAEINLALSCKSTTLYPVRIDECRRIFLEKPPRVEPSLSCGDLVSSPNSDYGTYYKSYLKKYKRNNKGDYQLTNYKLLLAEDLLPDYAQCVRKDPKMMIHYSSLLPLTIRQLKKIQIYPRYINVGKVAKCSLWTQKMYLKNGNNLPVRVTLAPHSDTILCSRTYNFVVSPNGEYICDIQFESNNIEGLFDVIIDVILNQSFVHRAIITGEIISKVVIFDKTELVFDYENGYEQYLDMYNPFDTTVFYTVHTLSSSFMFEPSLGEIEGCSHHIIVVTYDPNMPERERELTIQIEGQWIQAIPLKVPSQKPSVKFLEKKLSLENLSLNQPTKRYVHIFNDGYAYVSFAVMNTDILPGINITPREGTLQPKSTTELTISIKIPACINFQRTLEVMIDGSKKIFLEVSGDVAVPKLTVTPMALTFTKMIRFSVDSRSFEVKNQSRSDVCVEFLLDEYKEFKLMDRKGGKAAGKISLKPGELKEFVLYFYPEEISANLFCLPMLINDIIYAGNLQISQEKYDSKLEEFGNLKDVVVKPLEKLPMLRVSFFVTEEILYLSSRKIYLNVLPLEKNMPTDVLSIVNKAEHTLSVGLCVDKVLNCFRIECNDCKNESNGTIIYKTLESGQTVEFSITFEPEEAGVFESFIPLYVDSLDNKIFSIIEIEGCLQVPSFVTPDSVICLEPIPITCKSTKNVRLTLVGHSTKCICSSTSSDPDLEVSMKQINTDTAQLILEFSSQAYKILDASVLLSCTCGTKYTLIVRGCTESSSITNHVFLHAQGINDFQSDFHTPKSRKSFLDKYNSEVGTRTREDVSKIFQIISSQINTTGPAFPSEVDEKNFRNYMRTVLDVLESWVYTQVFYCKKFLKIPEGFTMNGQNNISTIPYLQLLQNLAGEKVVKNIIKKVKLLDTKMYYKYTIYQKVKELLVSLGAALPNVKPEYLLSFDELKELIEQNFYISEELPFSEEEFYLYSIQSWIDLLLQTFKIFYLNRCLLSNTSLITPETESIQKDVEGNIDNIIYSKEEYELLVWLEKNYNLFKDQVSANLPNKYVKLFNWDLNDGIILIVVTAGFCPYIKNEFKHCFYSPINFEQITYNVAKLLQVWKLLGSKFEINVSEILMGNVIQMIMLVAYLYTFLPALSPKESVLLSAGINESTSHSITLFNENSYDIKYTVTIFNNFYNSLSISHQDFVMKSGEKIDVTIDYMVINIEGFNATILFSGECQGFHYASSLVFEIRAIVDLTRGYYEIIMPCKACEMRKKEIKIQTFIREACEMEIFYCQTTPTLDSLTSYQSALSLDLPYGLFPSNGPFMPVDENGILTGQIQYCQYVPLVAYFYLIMRNKKHGDVGIMLKMICKENPPPTITLHAPLHMSCQSSFGSSLANIIYVNIPCRNTFIWEALQKMYFFQLGKRRPDVLPYWQENFNKFSTVSVLQHLIRSYAHLYKSLPYMFTGIKTKYYVELVEACEGITVPPFIEFPCSEPDRYAKLPIQINSTSIPEELLLRLVHEDRGETRLYCVKFIKT